MKGKIVESRWLNSWVNNKPRPVAGDEHYFDNIFPIDIVNKMLVNAGFDPINQDDFQTNGWEVNFTCPLNHKDQGVFTLSGSLFLW